MAALSTVGEYGRESSFWRRDPRWAFHLWLVIPAFVWMVSRSVPGIDLPLWLLSLAALAGFALLWARRAMAWWEDQPGGVRGSVRWFVVAPVAAVLVFGMQYSHAPLRVRWLVSRPAFDAVVDQVQRGEPVVSEPGTLGFYHVSWVHPVGDAVFFYERTGLGFDDAGFAYLPDGPTPALENEDFEAPEYVALGGPWYAWTASW